MQLSLIPVCAAIAASVTAPRAAGLIAEVAGGIAELGPPLPLPRRRPRHCSRGPRAGSRGVLLVLVSVGDGTPHLAPNAPLKRERFDGPIILRVLGQRRFAGCLVRGGM